MQKVNKGVGVEIVTHLGVGVAEAINFGPTCVLKGKRLHRIPATLVVGFTAQRSIFRCCPFPLPNFKIVRFSLRLCI